MTQEVPDLPPLPEPKWIAIDTDGADSDVTFVPTRHQAQDILIDIPEEHRSSAELYTADQMLAFRAEGIAEALTQAVADAQRTLARVLEIASFNPNRTDDQSILRGRLLQIQDVVREAMRQGAQHE